MIGILADIVEIVVLATSTNAFLSIDGALQLCLVPGRSAQEDGLELVHARIAEKQCWVIVLKTVRKVIINDRLCREDCVVYTYWDD